MIFAMNYCAILAVVVLFTFGEFEAASLSGRQHNKLSHANVKKHMVKLGAINHLAKKQRGGRIGKLKQCGDEHDKCMSDAGLDWEDPDMLDWSEDQWTAAGACVEGFATCAGGEKAEVCGTDHEACFNAAGLGYGDDVSEWGDDDFNAAEACGHDYLTCLIGPDSESRKVKGKALSHLAKRRRGGGGGGKLKKCGDEHDECMSDAGLDWEDPDMLEWSEDQWTAAGTCVEGFATCAAGGEKAEVCGTDHEACFNAAGLGYGDDVSEWGDDDFDAAEACGHDYLTCLIGPVHESRKADKTSIPNVKKHLVKVNAIKEKIKRRG